MRSARSGAPRVYVGHGRIELVARVQRVRTKLWPTVVGVHLSTRHAFSKAAAESIRLIENIGVEGDAHAGATDQHLFHIRRFGEIPNLRQVHLIHGEFLDELANVGHVVSSGALGENITTRGVDLLSLPTGACLKLGPDAVVEITGLRNPASRLKTSSPDFSSSSPFQHLTVCCAEGA
jgi:MOSC domain-containing protein YiiM